MADDLRRRLLKQIKQATDDVARAIDTRDIQLFNDARDKRLLLQARLNTLGTHN